MISCNCDFNELDTRQIACSSQNFNHKNQKVKALTQMTQDKFSRLSKVINNLHKKVPHETISQCKVSNLLLNENGHVYKLEVAKDYIEKTIYKEDENGEKIFQSANKQPVKEHTKDLLPNKCNYLDDSYNYVIGGEEMFGVERNFNMLKESNTEKLNKLAVNIKYTHLSMCCRSKSSDTSFCYNTATPDNCDNFSENQLQINELLESYEDLELVTECKDLLNDLISQVSEEIDEMNKKLMDNNASGFVTKSNNCGLLQESIVSVLPSHQLEFTYTLDKLKKSSDLFQSSIGNPKRLYSQAKNSKENIVATKHLCLFCNRKFASISLRQRHVESAHYSGICRRSQRNLQNFSQRNCHYCVSNKLWDDLEHLFYHMVKNHNDKYFGCLPCHTRFLSKKSLQSHNHAMHRNNYIKWQLTNSNDKSMITNENALNQSLHENTDIKEKLRAFRLYSKSNSGIVSNGMSHKNIDYRILKKISDYVDINIKVDSSTNKELRPFTDINYDVEKNQPVSSCSIITYSRRPTSKKYILPQKYNCEQKWNYFTADLSRFDLSTQLLLKKKHNILKDLTTLTTPSKAALPKLRAVTEKERQNFRVRGVRETAKSCTNNLSRISDENDGYDLLQCNENIFDEKLSTNISNFKPIHLCYELQSFLKLNENNRNSSKHNDITFITADLSGEWSRPRFYICEACDGIYVSFC